MIVDKNTQVNASNESLPINLDDYIIQNADIYLYFLYYFLQ